jgi:hypothetical protein
MDTLIRVLERIPFVGRFIGRYSLLILKGRREIHAAAAAVANELQFNAGVVMDFEAGTDIRSIQERLVSRAWELHETTLHALVKTDDSELWQEVAEAYASLQRTRLQAARPPHIRPLIDLADRLRQVSF